MLLMDNGEWMCVNAVTVPMSGSNFNDEDRKDIKASIIKTAIIAKIFFRLILFGFKI